MARHLRFMWKDSESGKTNCPALYRVGDGWAVQGKLPKAREYGRPGYWVYGPAVTDPAELAQVRQLADDEMVVHVESLNLAVAPDTEDIIGGSLSVVWVPASVLDRLPVG